MRRFGVEIEVTGITQQRAIRALNLVGINATSESYNHSTRTYWKTVTDASVHGGFELVSPPLQGNEGLEQVRAAITALDDAGAKVNRTCGLHVHFDASDLSADDIKTIILRYARFEDQIDSFMPPSRRNSNNQYTQSIQSLAHADLESASSIDDLARLQRGRYYKLNLQSYHRHGTIEFRQHSGTVNAPKALNWIRFLDAFITESQRQARDPEAQGQPLAIPQLSGCQARLASLIAQGATIEQLMEALNWQRHTTRAAISRLRRTGCQIESQRRAGTTTYRLAGQAQAARENRDSLFRGIPGDIKTFYTNRAAILNMG